MAAYLTSKVYLEESPEEIAVRALRQCTRERLLIELAVLNAAVVHKRVGAIQDFLLQHLMPGSREALRDWLAHPRRVFLARQQVVNAIRRVLQSQEPAAPEGKWQGLLSAILLCHSASDRLGSDLAQDTELAPGVPVGIGIELVQNTTFNTAPDVYRLFEMYSKLWSVQSVRMERVHLRRPPLELLREASGLDPDEFFALAMALYAAGVNWSKPGDPIAYNNLFDIYDERAIRAFLAVVAAPIERLSEDARVDTSDWDTLTIEVRPVLEASIAPVVLDPVFLLRRVTSGLYWIVHDYERRHGGAKARNRWSQAYGEMMELQIEDDLALLAPPIVSGGGKSYFTEDDFAKAYPGSKAERNKACDACIDLGASFLLAEIQSSQLGVRTRLKGLVASFEKDTERLVLKKAVQIDETARNLLEDEERLTGVARVARRRIVPVIIVGGGYPITPGSLSYISQRLEERELLADGRIDKLCVLTTDELDRLVAIHKRGPNAADVLRRWTSSGFAAMPFREFTEEDGELRRILDEAAAECERPSPTLKRATARLTIPKRAEE
jgi:hypothetical protein